MNFWSLLEATSGASQPAFKTYRHGAAQPVGEGALPSQHVAECAGIRVVSFNFGMPQSMLESARQWNNRHIFKFRDVLSSLGHAAGNDFVFCSEVGDARKGLQAANLDCRNIVADALPGAAYSNSGAYLHVWNVRHQAAAVVASGTWSATTAHTTDVHWQAFDLNYRDASQLAGRVGVLVGNMHIPCGSNAPTMNARKKSWTKRWTTSGSWTWRHGAAGTTSRCCGSSSATATWGWTSRGAARKPPARRRSHRCKKTSSSASGRCVMSYFPNKPWTRHGRKTHKCLGLLLLSGQVWCFGPNACTPFVYSASVPRPRPVCEPGITLAGPFHGREAVWRHDVRPRRLRDGIHGPCWAKLRRAWHAP